MQITGAIPSTPVVGGAVRQEPKTSEGSFGEALQGAIDKVDQMQANATGKIEELLAGNGQDVHSAMLAVQQANLSFELMVQIRNKMVSAYQEISRLQF